MFFSLETQLATTHAKDKWKGDLHAECILMSKTSNCGTRSNEKESLHAQGDRKKEREWCEYGKGCMTTVFHFLIESNISLRTVSQCCHTHTHMGTHTVRAIFLHLSFFGRGNEIYSNRKLLLLNKHM